MASEPLFHFQKGLRCLRALSSLFPSTFANGTQAPHETGILGQVTEPLCTVTVVWLNSFAIKTCWLVFPKLAVTVKGWLRWGTYKESIGDALKAALLSAGKSFFLPLVCTASTGLPLITSPAQNYEAIFFSALRRTQVPGWIIMNYLWGFKRVWWSTSLKKNKERKVGLLGSEGDLIKQLLIKSC